MKKLLILLIAVNIIFANQLLAQVYGCTDSKANNYNPSAIINDGSCTYNVTLYNPQVRYLLPDEIEESSGLAYFKDKLWTINDSGGLPVLYAFDTTSGEILQRITVLGATNVDWESLADDEHNIYIGDFGNNSGIRDDLTIYKVNKSTISDEGNGSVLSNKITFTYSDYPSEKIKSRNHNFDCESFIAKDEWLYLFSKNRGDQKTKLYRLPVEPGDYVAEHLATFDSKGLITGADINVTCNEVTLIGYVDQSWIPFSWLLFDYDDNDFFSGNKRRIDMPNIVATQTEAIAYTIDKKEIITSEGHLLFSQSAYNFNSGNWTNNSPSEVADVLAEKFDFVLSHNPIKKGKLSVTITSLPVGEYQLEVFNISGKLLNIKKYSMKRSGGTIKIKFKVGKYPPGVYFVRLSSGSQMVEKKFIKN